ncbi:MAG: hypothetical protein E6R03_08830 [Hyphomicrobiaceae bacterium]|nr:MAG: hypothetical protein E6R03_08830 [Hyphomicrobiaceae bacterium]
MAPTPKTSEVELARPVVQWLRARDFEVHQEVVTGEGRADIVVVLPSRALWIIECKNALTFDLLDQAERQHRCAHYVSVAVPAVQRKHREEGGRALAYRWLRDHGIGLLEVERLAGGLGLTVGDPTIREVTNPRLTLDGRAEQRWVASDPYLQSGPWRQAKAPRTLRAARIRRLREFLCAETQTFAEAGNNKGAYWSHKKEIVQAIQRATREPRTTKEIEAILRADHRFLRLTARQVYSWLYNAWVADVKRVEGRPLRFHYQPTVP